MAKQDVTVELFYSSVWNDVTSDVYRRNDITIRRGRGPESPTTPPAQATLTFDNRGGTYNPQNPNSALYGLVGRNTPLRITVGTDVRFVGEVASWTPRRSLGGDQWTDVVAAGITRRLGQGADPLGSALRRYLPDTDPIGYWPLEADSGLSNVADPARPGKVSGARLEFGVVPGPPGGQAGPRWVVQDDRPPVNQARFDVAGTDGDWVVSLWFRADPGPESSTFSAPVVDFIEIEVEPVDGSDSARYWMIEALSLPGSQVEVTALAFDEDRTLITTPSVLSAQVLVDLVDGAWHMVTFRVHDAVAPQGLEAILTVDDDPDGSDSVATADWLTGPIRRVYLPKRTDAANVTDLSMTHLAVWEGGDQVTAQSVIDRYNVGQGRVGELAEDRFSRLVSTEHGITATYVGTADDTQPMGPQRPATLLELLAEIEATDGGFIFDTRGEVGLTMHGGRALYNQTVPFELTFGTDVAAPLDPVVDDRDVRNDVTASRPGGGEARAVLESGPMSVQAPPAGVGRVTHRVDVNPQSDLDLPNHAGWHLHLGTVEGARYPQVTVILTDAGATLIEDASAVDVGDLLTIDDLEPDLVRLIVVGYTETIGSHTRRVTFNCVPAEPFQIAEVEHATLGVLGSDSATIAEALDTTETGVDINAGAGPDWVHEVDFDIVIGGERMTVTAVGAMGGTFPNRTCTLTVTRSVNGVVKSHASGAPVAFAEPAYIGL